MLLDCLPKFMAAHGEAVGLPPFTPPAPSPSRPRSSDLARAGLWMTAALLSFCTMACGSRRHGAREFSDRVRPAHCQGR